MIIQAKELKKATLLVGQHALTRRRAETLGYQADGMDCLHFVEDNGQHILTAANPLTMARYELPFPYMEDIAVSACALTKWVRRLRRDELVDISSKEGNLILHTDRFSTICNIQDSCATWEELETCMQFALTAPPLLRAAASDHHRPSLRSMILRLSDGLLYCADGFRIHAMRVNVARNIDCDDDEIIMPVEAFRGLAHVNVQVGAGCKKVKVSEGAFSVITPVIDGHVSSISKIEAYATDVDQLHPVPLALHAVVRGLGKEPPILLQADGVLINESASQTLYHVPLPVHGCVLNPHYLSDALRFVGLNVGYRQANADAPVCIKGEDRYALIMPFKREDDIEDAHPLLCLSKAQR